MKKLFLIIERIARALESISEQALFQSDWNQTDETAPDYIKNKPVALEVEDITAITAEQLDALKPGDVVAKITGNQKHAYVVSYKGEGAGEGICLTYKDAGYGETVSYDRVEDGWAYNSTDAIPVPTKTSDLTNDSAFVDGTNVAHIVKITQEDYDLIVEPDPATLYIIIEEEPTPTPPSM